jgi:hypothetical protein
VRYTELSPERFKDGEGNLMTNSESKMKPEDHTKWVGAILTNLQALETVLRFFLLTVNGQAKEFPKPGAKDTVINYLTDYRSLGNLMMLYNEKLNEKETEYAVDIESVVLIRDAFAHGRLVTVSDLPATLWKFGQPTNGRVPIEFSQVLTLNWLTEKSKFIDDQREKVVACYKARGLGGLR